MDAEESDTTEQLNSNGATLRLAPAMSRERRGTFRGATAEPAPHLETFLRMLSFFALSSPEQVDGHIDGRAPGLRCSQAVWTGFLNAHGRQCCRKGEPFQGPGVGSSQK